MKRILLLVAFAAALGVGGPVSAQGPQGKEGFNKKAFFQGGSENDGIKKLEAELDRLRGRIQELEGRLKKSSAPEGESRGSGVTNKPKPFADKGPGGPPWMKKDGPPWAKKDGPPWTRTDLDKKDRPKAFADWMKDFGPKDGRKGFDKKDGPPFGPPPFARGALGGGGVSPEMMKQMKERFAEGKKGSGPKDGWKGVARKGAPPPVRARSGFGGPGPGESRRSSSVEDRLDRIQHEIESLRRELRRR